jgi:hypothetical protein
MSKPISIKDTAMILGIAPKTLYNNRDAMPDCLIAKTEFGGLSFDFDAVLKLAKILTTGDVNYNRRHFRKVMKSAFCNGALNC